MVTHKEALERAVATWFEGNKAFVKDWHIEQMKASIREFCEAKGLVMVPREPTEEMITAAFVHTAFPKGTWEAMLAAAPDPFGEAP